MSVRRTAGEFDVMCGDVRNEEREGVAQAVRREPGLFYFSYFSNFCACQSPRSREITAASVFAASGWGGA